MPRYIRDESHGLDLTFLPVNRSDPDGNQDPLRFAFLCFKVDLNAMLPKVGLVPSMYFTKFELLRNGILYGSEIDDILVYRCKKGIKFLT